MYSISKDSTNLPCRDVMRLRNGLILKQTFAVTFNVLRVMTRFARSNREHRDTPLRISPLPNDMINLPFHPTFTLLNNEQDQ